MVSARWDDVDGHEPIDPSAAGQRIEMRLTRWELELIERAAVETGRTVADFVVASAAAAAAEVLRDQQVMRLNDRDSERFLAALDEEPEAIPALQKAAARSRERFGE